MFKSADASTPQLGVLVFVSRFERSLARCFGGGIKNHQCDVKIYEDNAVGAEPFAKFIGDVITH